MDKTDLKEKLIISSVMVGIFLPARLVFSELLSDWWIGSLGMVSIFAVALFVLIKQEKLGRFGKIFERQMKKTVGSNFGQYVILLSFFFLVFFIATMVLIERGNTVHVQDKELFYDEIVSMDGYTIENITREDLKGPIFVEGPVLQFFSVLEYGLSISYAVSNDLTEQWLSHILIVLIVEQLEVTGLLVFYRKVYSQESKNQTKTVQV